MKGLKNYVVGVDTDARTGRLTVGSRAAAAHALWMAERSGARVEFLHSTHAGAEDEPRAPDIGPELGHELAALSAEFPGADVVREPVVTQERPDTALTRRVLGGHADVVVIAKRNHTDHDGRRLGSISTKLLRYCPGVVWVVRPDHPTSHECVLAATDLSHVGDRAVEYGAFVAETSDCKLVVVHSWQVPMELQLAAARMDEAEIQSRRHEIEEAALRHIRALPGVSELGDRLDILLANDAPSHAIRKAVELKNPDLVVMGTVSRSGLSGFLVGNTAEKILHELDCSILAVKPVDFVSPVKAEG